MQRKYRPAKRTGPKPPTGDANRVIHQNKGANKLVKRLYTKTRPDQMLKYWTPIKKYFLVRHKLTTEELELMLFLDSEEYFTKATFDEFNFLLRWDAERLEKLIYNKWIDVWRVRAPNQKGLYRMSVKGRRLVTELYKALQGEPISEHRFTLKMFQAGATTRNKAYASYIKKINFERKKLQRLAHESQESTSHL